MGGQVDNWLGGQVDKWAGGQVEQSTGEFLIQIPDFRSQIPNLDVRIRFQIPSQSGASFHIQIPNSDTRFQIKNSISDSRLQIPDSHS